MGARPLILKWVRSTVITDFCRQRLFEVTLT
jgi:hypothetical protein